MEQKTFLLSIVIPVYNEESNIQPLLDRLTKVTKNYNHEIIFVDDGSTDNTISELKKATKKKMFQSKFSLFQEILAIKLL